MEQKDCPGCNIICITDEDQNNSIRDDSEFTKLSVFKRWVMRAVFVLFCFFLFSKRYLKSLSIRFTHCFRGNWDGTLNTPNFQHSDLNHVTLLTEGGGSWVGGRHFNGVKKSLYYTSFELSVRETIFAIVSVLLKTNISGKEDEICAVRNAATIYTSLHGRPCQLTPITFFCFPLLE